MDLVSIFLIIAIAADNILLLYNTYELAPAVMPSTSQSPGEKMRHNPLELTVEKSLSSTGDISIFFLFFWLVLGSRMEQKYRSPNSSRLFTWQVGVSQGFLGHAGHFNHHLWILLCQHAVHSESRRRVKQPFRLKVEVFVHLVSIFFLMQTFSKDRRKSNSPKLEDIFWRVNLWWCEERRQSFWLFHGDLGTLELCQCFLVGVWCWCEVRGGDNA